MIGVDDRSTAGGRVLRLLVTAGVLLTAAPVVAAPADERPARALLEQAARAAQTTAYSGTKYVAAWRSGGTSSALVDVAHAAGGSMVVTASPTAGSGGEDDALVLAATRLDGRLLDVLDEAYELRLAGEGRCTGRTADVVEAWRGSAVAGRFWVDRDTGLLLRRDVYDAEGRRVRSSAFVDLDLDLGADRPAPRVSVARQLSADDGEALSPPVVRRLRDDGWDLPGELPDGFALFDVRRVHGSDGDGQVLQLAYTDGLSTTSLFVQRGEPSDEAPDGFTREEVGGHAVWAQWGSPGRMVWKGGGQVWTVVSDAPDSALRSAVAALPHDPMPETGFGSRLGRGLDRLGGWLNPFD